MPPADTLDPNEKPNSATPLRRKGDTPAPALEAVPDEPENPFHIAVDEFDVEALKGIQRHDFPYGALRLWWQPYAARRGAGQVKPTHVTIMAEVEGDRLFALKLLEADRERRARAKAVVGHGQVHEKKPDTVKAEVCETPVTAETPKPASPPKPPQNRYWPYGFGGSEPQ